MLLKNKKELKRLEKILKGYGPGRDPVSATGSFVKEFLEPQPDRYDLTYRYEHSLRVALWGKRIGRIGFAVRILQKPFGKKNCRCEENFTKLCNRRCRERWIWTIF